MAKVFHFYNPDKTINVEVLTDGIDQQARFFITDIKNLNSLAVRRGLNLDIQPITSYQLDALATSTNLSLDVYENNNFLESLNVANNELAEITSYEFTGVTETSVVINSTAGTITVNVPALTVVTALVANFVLSTSATAKIGATAQVSGTTANNFSTAKTYTITSQNGNIKSWVVTVVVAA